MSNERYLQLRQPNIKDMHNTALLKACKEDKDLLEEFLKYNKDFIFSIIIKYKGNIEELKAKFKVDEEEVLQHAFIGTITALREFDFDRGFKFTTFVVRPILWEINQLLYSDSRLVRLSRGAIELLKRMRELEEAVGYTLPDEEVAEILKVPVERIRDIARFTKEMSSIEDITNELVDKAKDSEDRSVNRVYVEQLLQDADLSEEEEMIVQLIMDEGLNNSQIADRLGKYPMTINRTISRIRSKIQNANLEDRRVSKYEEEIKLATEEMEELGYIIPIEEMKDLFEVCELSDEPYSPRILYYIRQKALQRVDVPLEDAPTKEVV